MTKFLKTFSSLPFIVLGIIVLAILKTLELFADRSMGRKT